MAWTAFREAQIGLKELRVYFALAEMKSRRCGCTATIRRRNSRRWKSETWSAGQGVNARPSTSSWPSACCARSRRRASNSRPTRGASLRAQDARGDPGSHPQQRPTGARPAAHRPPHRGRRPPHAYRHHPRPPHPLHVLQTRHVPPQGLRQGVLDRRGLWRLRAPRPRAAPAPGRRWAGSSRRRRPSGR